ncbi:MAG: patatin-like phospholipase family protein [Candidatus Obscuribacterales bacterium]|nr:patatin-like phospholipase family protein [Candidatus Obscuribacterales bacterium]
MRSTYGIVLSLVVAGSLVACPVMAQVSQESDQTSAITPESTSDVVSSTSKKRPRIGLALGGGGSRGGAHVGVLQVLKEEKIPIDIIAGTSIGSVVGGFYAAGMSMDDMGDVFRKKTFTKEFTPMPILRLVMEPVELTLRVFGYKPYDGLYFGWKFRNYANKAVGEKKIEELSIPYAAVVTDMVTGKSCRLTEGNLGVAMTASTAVPELRKPVEIDNKLYCDGGLINNVPVNHVREMGADFVIAVNIDEHLKVRPIKDFRALGSMGRQALRIQLAVMDKPSCEKADVAIQPDTTGINLVSFKKSDGQRGIDAGVAACREAMPEIKRKLAALGVMSTASNESLK